MSNSLQPHRLQHSRLLCPPLTPSLLKFMSVNLVTLTIPSSVVPFPFCLQSFPAWGSFPMSQLFPSGGQSTGASALASVLPMNIQDWFPLGLTGLISLQSKGLFKSLLQHHSSKTSILQCLAFFLGQLSHSYMTNGKTTAFDYTDLCWQCDVSGF